MAAQPALRHGVFPQNPTPMKLRIPLLIAALALPFTLAAAPSPISIRVEQVNKSDNAKHGKTQSRMLKVNITNGSADDKSGLVVKYWVFAKEVKDRDLVVLGKGELPAQVKSHGTEIVETPTFTAKSTEDHYEMKKPEKGRSGQKNNKGPQLGKKIEGGGEKMAGYAVKVFDGGTLVAEAYEPLGMKEQMGDAQEKAAPAAPKKKK
jgi:hypothetical protein